MKKIITVLLAALFVTSGAVWAEEAEINIAPQSVISVSSTYGLPGMEPELAVDEDDTTAWGNGYFPNGENYFRLSFSFPQNVNTVSLLMHPSMNKDFEVRLITGDAFTSGGYDVLYSCGSDEPASDRLTLDVTGELAEKKYSGVMVITHAVNGPLGICDLKVFVPDNQVELINVAKDKPVTGGGNAFGIAPEDLVDGDNITIAAIQDIYPPYYIDIDLGRRYPISRIELFTVDYSAYGGYRSGIQIYGSNTPGFTDPEDMVLLKQFDEEMTSMTSYGFDVDGSEYRYIRFTCAVQNFVPMAELSVFAEVDENFGRWTLSDSANEITVLEGKTPASIGIPVTNNTGAAKSYTLIALITGPDGKVLSSAAKTQSIDGEDTITAELTGYSEALPAGCRIKAILVDNYIGMNQLCGGFEIDERGMAQ